jgi:hypothetical protein
VGRIRFDWLGQTLGMRRLLTAIASLALAACGSPLSTLVPAAPTPTAVAPAASIAGSPIAGSPAPTAGANEPIRIPLSGAAPDAILLDGTTAWVLAGEGGTVMQVDLSTMAEVRAIPVGFGATHLGHPLPDTLAVARFDDGGTGTYLQLVDASDGIVDGVKGEQLGAMTAGEAGIVWALEKAGRLVKVDASARTVIKSAPVAIGQNVHVEVQWGAGSAWVGSDGLPVTRLNGDSLAVEATIEVPSGIPFDFDNGRMWGAGPTDLWAIDPATNAITSDVDLVNVAEILGIDIDGDDAWLAVRHPGQVGAVIRMDLVSGTVVEEHAVSLPAAVKLDAEHAWVASYLTNELLGYPR